MLTDQDLQKIRKVVKEEVQSVVREETKDFLTKVEFKSEMASQLFELKTEIVRAFAPIEELSIHKHLLLDHEARLRFIEKYRGR